MEENRRKERLKQLIQVVVDKKNSGKQPGTITRLSGMNMKDFKLDSYKLKVCFYASKVSILYLGNLWNRHSFRTWTATNSTVRSARHGEFRGRESSPRRREAQ